MSEQASRRACSRQVREQLLGLPLLPYVLYTLLYVLYTLPYVLYTPAILPHSTPWEVCFCFLIFFLIKTNQQKTVCVPSL